MMNHRERFIATVDRKPVDRPACWLGMPMSTAMSGLYKHFKVDNPVDLKVAVDDDVWEVDVPYDNPPTNHVACAFNFAKKGPMAYENRTLTAPGFFEDCKDPAKVGEFDWPDPAVHIDPEKCREVVDAVPRDYPVLGVLWSAHFQDLLAAFGMERCFVRMQTHPAVVEAVSSRIVDFYLKANEIFYKATSGRLDAVLVGNDFGGQKGLMIHPKKIERFALPGAKKIVDQAKARGLKVIYHSCGSVYEAIPMLVDLKVDAIHPIQALADQMEPWRLKANFGNQVSFCGGVDHQHLLVNGKPDDVIKKVLELRRIFPTGLVISPSHEAIVPDIPPRNIEAMLAAVKRGKP